MTLWQLLLWLAAHPNVLDAVRQHPELIRQILQFVTRP